jgi:hypothetical protein
VNVDHGEIDRTFCQQEHVSATAVAEAVLLAAPYFEERTVLHSTPERLIGDYQR